MASRVRAYIKTSDEIIWYYEQEGSGPHIVLVPSGLGDCATFGKTVSLIAASGFTVTTFDMPGMSRSSQAPESTYQQITAQKLAGYVINLLDSLGIKDPASFWGSSSGGATVLAIAQGYPERVRNIMPHEVPTYVMRYLDQLLSLDDAALAAGVYRESVKFCGNEAAWEGLGQEVHGRLKKNSVRWVRGYISTLPQSSPVDVAYSKPCPIDWSVGALTPTGEFLDNIVTATKAGVNFVVIRGRHHPYLSDPESFSEHVSTTVRKYLD